MDERRVMYKDKWDCDMDRIELLALVGMLLDERRWRSTQFRELTALRSSRDAGETPAEPK